MVQNNILSHKKLLSSQLACYNFVSVNNTSLSQECIIYSPPFEWTAPPHSPRKTLRQRQPKPDWHPLDTKICEIAIKGRYILSSFEISRLLRCSQTSFQFSEFTRFLGMQVNQLIFDSSGLSNSRRLNVFDHVCLICSILVCCSRTPLRCRWWQTHACWWT